MSGIREVRQGKYGPKSGSYCVLNNEGLYRKYMLGDKPVNTKGLRNKSHYGGRVLLEPRTQTSNVTVGRKAKEAPHTWKSAPIGSTCKLPRTCSAYPKSHQTSSVESLRSILKNNYVYNAYRLPSVASQSWQSDVPDGRSTSNNHFRYRLGPRTISMSTKRVSFDAKSCRDDEAKSRRDYQEQQNQVIIATTTSSKYSSYNKSVDIEHANVLKEVKIFSSETFPPRK